MSSEKPCLAVAGDPSLFAVRGDRAAHRQPCPSGRGHDGALVSVAPEAMDYGEPTDARAPGSLTWDLKAGEARSGPGLHARWHTALTSGGHLSYLEAGPADAELVIFVHGWPAAAVTWYPQLLGMAEAGYRVIAPDMRGYGRSWVPRAPSEYELRHLVQDLRDLLAAARRSHAVWVGHDWGAAVVWALAAHHPEKCIGVSTLVVPYRTLDRGIDAMLPYVNRQVYPKSQFPLAQFDYLAYYEDAFDEVTAQFDAAPDRLVRALYRRGDSAILTEPSPRSTITRDGGWFGGASTIPHLERDTIILNSYVYEELVSALRANGFFGPNSWYLNHHRNLRYSEESVNDGMLTMPALFVESRYEPTADTFRSQLAEPMRAHCADLTEVSLEAGHWVGLEKPAEVNAALRNWLETRVSR